MVTISENKTRSFRYGNSQFRYALTYVIITFAALLFLNIYISKSSQGLFYESKKAAMIERCQMAASEIAELEVMNASTVYEAVNNITSLRDTRIIITDHSGLSLYDSLEPESVESKYFLLPEIVTALRGNDVFTSQYQDGILKSQAATPIISYGVLNGCMYMMEYDTAQGAMIQSLQRNTLSVTVVLEILVILFSYAFAKTFSERLRKIMTSMRIIRKGEYSHKVILGGNDELTVLGEEFNDLTERLQTSEDKRRQFVSDASHELKTPLASIKLLSDSILQNDMDMETVREFVGDIGNEAERLNRMSQKLLSLSRVDGLDEQECEIITVEPTIRRVMKMLSVIAQKNHIDLSFECVQDSPILINEDDLYEIIFNLVENGIKYNLPGGSLHVQLLRRDDNALLQIRDTGVGIPEHAISHLFERFYRVDKARSRKSGGSGLGLAIVRNMVERYGGSIQVDSILGQGSTFTVIFPVFDTEEGQA